MARGGGQAEVVEVHLIPPPPGTLIAQRRLRRLPVGIMRTEEGRLFCKRDGAEMIVVGADTKARSAKTETPGEGRMSLGSAESFLIDRVEVTVGQYERFSNETGRSMPRQLPESTEHHPVVWVKWDAATAYATWTGRRLPSEEEWERAARGPEGRVYPWGNADDECRRNGPGAEDGFVGIAPVGSYASGVTQGGAFDMAGNVWEWCEDWYNESFYQNPQAVEPLCAIPGEGRVLRGGSWNYTARYCRAACRYRSAPDVRNFAYSFRVVCAMTGAWHDDAKA